MAADLDHVLHGFGAVRPYVHAPLATWEILRAALGAVELLRHDHDATSCHLEARIDDSVIVLELNDEAHPTATPNQVYVYVKDVDRAYARALEAGAISHRPPADQPYRERNCGVRDAFGNLFWLSQLLEAR